MYRENLKRKDKQITVAEPPGQSKIETPTRGQEKVWRRWSTGNPTRQRDVSGDQDAARGEVKASVPLVVRGVPKKHTTSRAGRQLVRSSGGGVRVTRTPENPKVVVARRGTEKSVVWSLSLIHI